MTPKKDHDLLTEMHTGMFGVDGSGGFVEEIRTIVGKHDGNIDDLYTKHHKLNLRFWIAVSLGIIGSGGLFSYLMSMVNPLA